MRFAIAGTVVFVFVALLSGCADGDSRMDKVNALMQRYTGQVPGASLLVIKNGKPLVRRGYGMANLEKDIQATPNTNYRLASMTKQFTAAAIMLLKEDGRLDLSDPIRKWLPSLPPIYQPITIRQLLTHTSGIVDFESLISPQRTTQLTDADVLRMVSESPSLYFKPGTDYSYSNTGYVLLGLIVEAASGQPFQTFLKERIFEPLGMDQTLLYVKYGPPVPNRAYGYSWINGEWARTDQSLTSSTRGDGGIYSSIDDLAKWDAALYDDRLLSDKSRHMMFTAHTKTDVPGVKYGFGWRITGQSLWHSGETMGFRNVIIRYPEQHLTVILLSNRNHPKPYPTALKIAQLYLEP